jgi:hypothetical protein
MPHGRFIAAKLLGLFNCFPDLDGYIESHGATLMRIRSIGHPRRGSLMSGVSLPVMRPIGRALVVAAPSARHESLKTLAQLGFECEEADEPYAAFVELCNHRLAYHAVILSLASLYREELSIITTIKRLLPHIDIWLTQTDGRQAAMAEGVRLGADGLLAEDGLHRIGQPAQTTPLHLSADRAAAEPESNDTEAHETDDTQLGEPVLTSDELRALLQDQPMIPPYNAAD